MSAAVAVVLAAAVPATAQIPDARVVPRGALRISFSTLYTNYDSRFALGSAGTADGTEEPLGTDLTTDALGASLFPSLLGATAAVRSITGDDAFEFNMGALFADLDADIRVFPLDFALGLSNRLTLNVQLPIVTSRVNSFIDLDSTGAEAGFNQIATNPADAAQATLLLADLAAAAAFVEGQIAGGGYGCPGSPTCDGAQATVARATALAASLGALTGLAATDGVLPPAAPLQSSSAGAAILAEITTVIGDLAALGAPAVGGGLTLPTSPLETGDLDNILTNPTFGYSMFPLATAKISRFGDMEVGLRYLLTDGSSLRTLIHTAVRLPTGQLDSPAHALDIGTGDRQTDITAGFEMVYAAGGRLGFSSAASYTYQMALARSMRITRTDRPIALAIAERTVSRNPGNILQASLHPWLQLGEGVQVFATVAYYNKAADAYSTDTPLTTTAGFTAEDLGFETSQRALSIGGGIAYRSTRNGRGVVQLPIEAGLNYASVFSGSGGMTPKSNRLNLYLRLYYRIFGGRTPQAAGGEGD